MAVENTASLMDPAPERAKRGAFFFPMLFMGIICAAWYLGRFLWGGTAVPKGADFNTAAVLTVIMLLSIGPMLGARGKLTRGQDTAALGNLTLLMGISVLMIVGIISTWGAVPIATGYGGIYDATSGWLGLYFVAAALAFLASVMKGKRALARFSAERWVAHNVVSFWGFMILMWTLFFIVFYLA
ncbi:hypothetical protein [Acidiferrobacter sp.]|uniref:hypothetical protein n=1 Tax=Acidiferrobacter sp. TaxID=1872107 RepID=UPI00261C46FB|nr:hypothetical protein [Acidiferrobacter sp.]